MGGWERGVALQRRPRFAPGRAPSAVLPSRRSLSCRPKHSPKPAPAIAHARRRQCALFLSAGRGVARGLEAGLWVLESRRRGEGGGGARILIAFRSSAGRLLRASLLLSRQTLGLHKNAPRCQPVFLMLSGRETGEGVFHDTRLGAEGARGGGCYGCGGQKRERARAMNSNGSVGV